MNRITYRNIQHMMLFLTILVLVYAFYSEHVYKLEPCPLCMMQRICAFIFGFLCLFALGLRTLRRARVVALIQMITVCLGIYFASRQLWLQSLPVDQTQMCMPGLHALVSYFSIDSILKAFFWGSHECAEVTGRWLGLSMAAWSAIYFVMMLLLNSVLALVLSLTLSHNLNPPPPPAD